MAEEEIQSIFPEWYLSPWPVNHIPSYFATSLPTCTENNVGILLIALAVEWAEAWHLYLTLMNIQSTSHLCDWMEAEILQKQLCRASVQWLYSAVFHKVYFMGNLTFGYVMS